MPAPTSRRTDDVIEAFGRRFADPYRWLEDVDAPEVQAWMDAQDRWARDQLTALPERTALLERCQQLLYYDAVDCPTPRGERLFYSRKHADREKRVVYVRDLGAEQVLFDPNTMSADGTISLGIWVPSRDGSLVAYALRENNADAATLHVRDVDAGSDLEIDVIPGAKYASPSWLPDGSGFYYTRLPTDPDIPIDELPGHAEVCFHAIGSDPATDRVVRGATGSPQTFIHGEVSRDGRWLVVYVQHGWNSTDVYLADREVADDQFATLREGGDALYELCIWNDQLFVHTNEGAPRYRVLTAPMDSATGTWRELVGESDDTLEWAGIIGGQLICRYLVDATSQLRRFTTDGAPLPAIELPGPGTVDAVGGEESWPTLFYSFSTFTEPTRVYRVDLRDGEPTVWAASQLEVGIDAVCEQVRYRSKDGTEVPMFILRRADIDANGQRPTVLSGYGGFNVSLTPSFSPQLIPWLERGGVYAIPNLRGGGEYGEAWHKAGMGASKQNVFDDFIAAAEHLVEAGWTRPERLAIRGGSNGGLLVGATMTQRPDLCRAVICAVPLLDMLRYHLFGSGRTWIPEYGSPEVKGELAVLAAYSPQQAVTDGTAYPALLMLAADSDDRVDPMHARKFVAAVQHATTSEHPVLLRIERNAGHGGADMVTQQIEQTADVYAFLCDQLGLQ